ncbi:MAG: DMSO/selenate family reductase complex B subunit [Tropicimonas sp.]|uniref:DMSO/selenate family reductase complex B subunit n=1 Tax=Tropicimonas sp. TaxID=2067044 RepID=UPI003A87D9B7
MEKQYGFFIDSSRCTGCKTCMIACKDYNDLPTEINYRRVYEFAGGEWTQDGNAWRQEVFAYYSSIACNHCADPACTQVCPTGAMAKHAENGLVIVNEDLCIGCKSCAMACPYGAPQYDAVKKHMTKCDGCQSRVSAGQKPVCVEACPLRALDFGPIDELRAEHGTLAAVAPLPEESYTQPSIVIKPNRKARPVGDRSGFLANPMEV